LEINIVEGFIRARLALSLDSEESLAADASFIDEDLVYSTLACRDGEGSWGYWRTSSRNTVSIVKSIASDAIACFSLGVVDCKGLASTTISIDVIEARDADACE
jgi:hypothetical protein